MKGFGSVYKKPHVLARPKLQYYIINNNQQNSNIKLWNIKISEQNVNCIIIIWNTEINFLKLQCKKVKNSDREGGVTQTCKTPLTGPC